jgi:peroxiredoxin
MAMPLRAGDPLPDVPLRDVAGDAVSMRRFGGEHTLVIFLRHLA